MELTITDLKRIRFATRRGMLELDLMLTPFFDARYEQLAPELQQSFCELLAEPDPDLFNYLMGHKQHANAPIQQVVDVIRQHFATDRS